MPALTQDMHGVCPHRAYSQQEKLDFTYNRIIKCICGCKFEYEQRDIMTDTSLAYTTCPEQYKRYVRCPECDAKTELRTTYVHSITQRF